VGTRHFPEKRPPLLCGLGHRPKHWAWERFPEEIDEASLTAFFSFADDELEQIAGHRDIHGRFAIAVIVGALRWLGFVPAALEEVPEPAAALIASQLDIALSLAADRLWERLGIAEARSSGG